MDHIAFVNHNGQNWPLRGTVIALRMERAQIFPSKEAAQAALVKAKPFMKAATFKKFQIMPLEDAIAECKLQVDEAAALRANVEGRTDA